MVQTTKTTITMMEEVNSCLLCHNAPCRSACIKQLPVDTIIRSLRYENPSGAACQLNHQPSCADCLEKPCLSACVKGKLSKPVAIDLIIQEVDKFPVPEKKEVDLSIDFCGVPCENPFFLSSSVVGSNYEMVAKAFSMGWAGVAFKTIGTFVPDEVSPRFDTLNKEALPFVGLKNIEQISEHTLEENVAYLKDLKKNFPSKILVASIMGQNEEEWTYLAKVMTEAGCDIIECNFSCPHMAADGLGSDVGQSPELVELYTKATRKGTNLPILAKMTPNIGNMEIPALAAKRGGCDVIAAINTIKSIMNVNLSTFSSGPDVVGRTSVGGYSGKAVKPIALRFIQNLATCEGLEHMPLSGMGGIESWRDVCEFMALGCENIQITTAVMQYGYRIIEDLIDGFSHYLSAENYHSISEIVGKALPQIISADDLERDSICFPKFNRSDCIGCGRCFLSCYDGGHQAIHMDESIQKPVLDAKKCVGCHLCLAVCPASAIVVGARIKKGKLR